jgi:hypothetical protein
MRCGVARAIRAFGMLLCALLAASTLPARAADTPSVQAHPALWTVHGPKATVYLLGSIHVLPKNLNWHTPQIDAALKSADVFVFEIPMDETQDKHRVQDFISKNGLLPAGMALPSMLNSEERQDYAAAVELAHVPADNLSPMRPWLAALTLQAGLVLQQHLSPDDGLDKQVYALALKKPGVSFRAFETLEQQLKLLMPEDQALELQEFDSDLKEMLTETTEVHDLIAAWSKGDVKTLNAITNTGFKDNPRAEKVLFEDRNRAWVVQLKQMLAENRIFFVTVGAGHLAGPLGVPALLRQEGYKVDGP